MGWEGKVVYLIVELFDIFGEDMSPEEVPLVIACYYYSHEGGWSVRTRGQATPYLRSGMEAVGNM